MTMDVPPIRYALALDVLGLDVTGPYLKAMGAPAGGGAMPGEALRPILREHHPAATSDADLVPFVTRAFAEIEKRLGHAAAGALRDWCLEVFPFRHEAQEQVEAWELVVWQGAQGAKRAPAPLPRAIRWVRRTWDLIEPEDDVDVQVSSDWDRGICGLWAADGEPLDPSGWIENAIRIFAFRVCWGIAARKVGTGDEFQQAFRWGQEVAESLPLVAGRLRSPEILLLPASLQPDVGPF